MLEARLLSMCQTPNPPPEVGLQKLFTYIDRLRSELNEPMAKEVDHMGISQIQVGIIRPSALVGKSFVFEGWQGGACRCACVAIWGCKGIARLRMESQDRC